MRRWCLIFGDDATPNKGLAVTEHVNLKLDYHVLRQISHRAVRRAAAFVAMGQKAWSDESIRSVAIEAPLSVRLLPDPLPDDLAKDIRLNFQLWVVGNAITELVQGLGHFADDFFESALLVTYHQKTVPQDAINRVRKCKSDTNLHSKLMRIVDATSVRPPLIAHTDGWTRARNALTHNNGIVRERDFTPEQGYLRVTWRQFEILINGERIESVIGHVVEKGGGIGFRLGNAHKDFAAGQRIAFTEQEILNICLTAHFLTDTSIKELEKHVNQHVNAA